MGMCPFTDIKHQQSKSECNNHAYQGGQEDESRNFQYDIHLNGLKAVSHDGRSRKTAD